MRKERRERGGFKEGLDSSLSLSAEGGEGRRDLRTDFGIWGAI